MRVVADTSALEGSVASGGQEVGGFVARDRVGLRNCGDPKNLPLAASSWSLLTRLTPSRRALSRMVLSRRAPSRLAPSRLAPSRLAQSSLAPLSWAPFRFAPSRLAASMVA